MSKEYTLADFTDIFDYSTGWFSDSSICSLFYQIFKRFPSMKMVKYKVYNKYVVKPTDTSCTTQHTNGYRELTLITCTNYGTERLVVKCREI